MLKLAISNLQEPCHIVGLASPDTVILKTGPLTVGPREVWIMRLLIQLAVFSGMLFLSGCALHQVKGEVAGVEIEAKTADAGGDFCPPGQAKKGNC